MNTTLARPSIGTARTALLELRDRNRILFTVALAQFSLAAVFTVLMALDGRTLLGRNVWTKPWKFATSIAIFTATVGWILPSLSLADRVERRVTYAVAAAMTIEIALIATQAARGVVSHFNTSTPLDTTIFAIMGATITVNTLVVGYVLWRIFRDPPTLAPAYLWGLRLGMFVFFVASFEGWLMVARDGHAVGAPADSAGRTLLNWSPTGGDLRIAHFVGLHSLQVLPLTGYLVTRWTELSTRGSLTAVGIVASLYGALTAVAFVQAMLGHPLLSSVTLPSVPTSAAAATILVATISGAVILTTTWRGDSPS